jgi:hypothetical protein
VWRVEIGYGILWTKTDEDKGLWTRGCDEFCDLSSIDIIANAPSYFEDLHF